jgi:hypothetical protein
MFPILVIRKKAKRVNVSVGPGLTFGRLGDAVAISSSMRRQRFEGAWYVDGEVEKDEVNFRVALGFLNLMEPKINGLPISGIDENGDPVPGGKPWLTGKPKFSVRGKGFVCLKVRCEESKDKKDAGVVVEDELEIVLSDTFGASGDTYLQPLAAYDELGGISQLAFFDYVYSAKKDESGAWQHLLLPSMNDIDADTVGRRAIIGGPPPVNYALKRWDM